MLRLKCPFQVINDSLYFALNGVAEIKRHGERERVTGRKNGDNAPPACQTRLKGPDERSGRGEVVHPHQPDVHLRWPVAN